MSVRTCRHWHLRTVKRRNGGWSSTSIEYQRGLTYFSIGLVKPEVGFSEESQVQVAPVAFVAEE